MLKPYLLTEILVEKQYPIEILRIPFDFEHIPFLRGDFGRSIIMKTISNFLQESIVILNEVEYN